MCTAPLIAHQTYTHLPSTPLFRPWDTMLLLGYHTKGIAPKCALTRTEDSTMELRPILSALLRHKTAAALIVLEIALSCAIVCTALFLIGNRIERINLVSGVAETEVVRVQLTGIGEDDTADALPRSDLASLRGLPGAQADTVP